LKEEKMKEYHKIQSLFKRDDKGNFTDEFTCPEFEYLQNNKWIGTEKIDGTNIRINWDGGNIRIGGRTDKAQIPAHLFERLTEITNNLNFERVFGEDENNDITLYGEGYGKKIQKAGSLYKPDGVDFVLFDININGWWLKREDVDSIAVSLGIHPVPVRFEGTVWEAIDYVEKGFSSYIAEKECEAEGLVLEPATPLRARNGGRIITKIKTKDFRK
jgi:hypothetical protein